MDWCNGKSPWRKCCPTPGTPPACSGSGILAERRVVSQRIKGLTSGMAFPIRPTVYSSLRDFAESGVSETFVMDGKKGSAPSKVRPYRLDYRPLIDRDLTDRAISFMRRQAEVGKPFFIYLPYTATHFPTLPHPDFVGRSGKGP